MKTPTNKGFQANARLRQVREKLGLMQKEMAKHLSLHPASYSALENGKSNMNQRHMELLRLRLRVSPKWLIEGSGPMILDDTRQNETEKRLQEKVYQLQEQVLILEDEIKRYHKIIDKLTD